MMMPVHKGEKPSVRKIPVLDWSADTGSYRDIPVDAADPRGAEPLVRFSDFGIPCESFYARTDGGNWPYRARIVGAMRHVWGRKGVAERLVRVNARLASFDAEVFVVDAYRSIKCQEGLWEFFRAQARREMPDATQEEQRSYVRNFISDPTQFTRGDSRTWPVHSSGGAVDVILRRAGTHEALDLGARFDEMSPDSCSDALERKLAAGEIAADDPRLLNRRLLHWAMAEEGFVNYPFEFWHFDYGDQMYVLHGRLLGLPVPAAAWYGYVGPPDED
jgi:D-alanyl-D-alanine dipeptidase